jgi:FkbM family methyltransferase
MFSEEERQLIKSLADRHGYSQVIFLAEEDGGEGSAHTPAPENGGAARRSPGKMYRFDLPELRAPIWLRQASTDAATFEQVFLHKQYHFPMPQQPRVIIDGGANIGLASIAFALRFPGAKIIAVEPAESNFEMLTRNTAAYPSITPVHAAIWPERGWLGVADPGLGQWGIQVHADPAAGAERCPAIPIRDLLDKAGSAEIDLLKLDIEGAEEELFSREYEEWIERVNMIVIETHEHIRHGSSAPFERAMASGRFTRRYAWGELHVLTRE